MQQQRSSYGFQDSSSRTRNQPQEELLLADAKRSSCTCIIFGLYCNPQAFDYSKLAPSNPEAIPRSSSSVMQPSVSSAYLAEPLPPPSIPGISPLLSNPQQLAGQSSSSSTSLLQPPQLFSTSWRSQPSLTSLSQQPLLFPSVEQPPLPFSQLSSRLDEPASLPYPSAVDLLLPMTSPLWLPSNNYDQPPSLASLSPPENHSTPQSSSTHIFDALVSLEKRVGRQQRDRFRRRLENGFDLTSDEVYHEWKTLRSQVGHGRRLPMQIGLFLFLQWCRIL